MLLVYAGLTILFEAPYFLLFWRKEGWISALIFCVLLNGFTNITLNLILSEANPNLWLMEGAVWIVEAAATYWMFRAPWWKALLFSLLANATSFGMGYVLYAWGWL